MHLSVCKYHITAAMHAVSEQDTTASYLQFQSRTITMTCIFMRCFLRSGLDAAICKDKILLHLSCARTCAESERTFHSVTKVTSVHHSQPLKAML